MEYTTIIQAELSKEGVDFDHFKKQFEAERKHLHWQRIVPKMSLPMMQGMAIREILTNFTSSKPERLAYNGGLSFDNFTPGLYGIETHHQRIYFLDFGTHVVPVALEDK